MALLNNVGSRLAAAETEGKLSCEFGQEGWACEPRRNIFDVRFENKITPPSAQLSSPMQNNTLHGE